MAKAITDPSDLARWLYENQGRERFGIENRFYVVVADTNDVEQSWRPKRDFTLLSGRLASF